MTNKPIRVLLVDDHTVVRTGLTYVLATLSDIEAAGEADSVTSALEQCAAIQPDVVLMDIKMAGETDGIKATALIRQQFPHIQVIALTSYYHHDLIEQVMQAGAIGYLLKNVSMDDLAEAIHGAVAGQPSISPEVGQVLAQTVMQPQTQPGSDLTARQRQVLALLEKGLSNREIAQQLEVTLPTARHHVSLILSKLGAANRTEAVALAIKHGLVEDN